MDTEALNLQPNVENSLQYVTYFVFANLHYLILNHELYAWRKTWDEFFNCDLES